MRLDSSKKHEDRFEELAKRMLATSPNKKGIIATPESKKLKEKKTG